MAAGRDGAIYGSSMGRHLLAILTKGSKDNTYKFALARFLLDHAHSSDKLRVEYEAVARAFLRYYWVQIYRYHIKQDPHTKKRAKIVTIIKKQFDGVKVDTYKKLLKKHPKKVEKATEEIMKCIFGTEKSKTSMVIPRFHNVAGADKKSKSMFYTFNEDEKILMLKPDAHDYLRKNYTCLFKAVILEWARKLEKINTMPRMIEKIERVESKKRSLRKFAVIYKNIDECFYCNEKISPDKMHIDHFIPWSYIMEDEAWNLVPTCPSCNMRKSNLLASNEFLKKLMCRNETYHKAMEDSRRRLETIMDKRIKKQKEAQEKKKMPAENIVYMSLLALGYERDWGNEIRTNYFNCRNHGYNTIDTSEMCKENLPKPRQ